MVATLLAMSEDVVAQWESGLAEGRGLMAVATILIPDDVTDVQARAVAYRSRDRLGEASEWATRNGVLVSPEGRRLEAVLVRRGTRRDRKPLEGTPLDIPIGESQCTGVLELQVSVLPRVHWVNGSDFYQLQPHSYILRCPNGCFEIQERSEGELLDALAAGRGRPRSDSDPGDQPFFPVLCESMFS